MKTDLEAYLSACAFWQPEYVVGSAWTEHAPFAYWLVDNLQPRVIVELGTHWGYSYFSFCQAVARLKVNCNCYAVDTWVGDEHAGFYDEEVYEAVVSHSRERYPSISTLIRSTFDNSLERFSQGTIDLLHIDGRHFYSDVRHDFDSWRVKLSDRSIVLFHDTNVREREFGVHRLWNELSDMYPSFEFLHAKGLGVLGYGKNLSHGLQSFFEIAKGQAIREEIRSTYARLGQAIRLRNSGGRNPEDPVLSLASSVAEKWGAAEARIEDLNELLSEVNYQLYLSSEEIAVAQSEHQGQIDLTRLEGDRVKSELDRRLSEIANLKMEITKASRREKRVKEKLDEVYESASWKVLSSFSPVRKLRPRRRGAKRPLAADAGGPGTIVPSRGVAVAELPLPGADPLSLSSELGGLASRRPADFSLSQNRAASEPRVLPLAVGAETVAGRVEVPRIDAPSARAIAAFCEMIGIDDARDLLRDFVGSAARWPDAPESAHVRPIPCLEGPADFPVVDAWFVNDSCLRFRFGASSAKPHRAYVAKFAQYDHLADGDPMSIIEVPLWGIGMGFADVPLRNPYFPILMSVTTPEVDLPTVSLLPFPSLIRGGRHYAELTIANRGENDIENLRAVSQDLLAEMLAESTVPSFSIARITIDLQDATGAEPIFSTHMRDWLATVMHINLVAAEASVSRRPETQAYLEESLAPAFHGASGRTITLKSEARENQGALCLTLPADGIPSLQALVSRSLGTAGERVSTTGSFVVADRESLQPRWSITVPPMGEELLQLQPQSAPVCYPVLSRLRMEANRHKFSPAPLGIRFASTRDLSESELIMPISQNPSGSFLRGPDRVRAQTISVLLNGDGTNELFIALLESLRIQTSAYRVEVVATVDVAEPHQREKTEVALQRFFPKQHTIVEDHCKKTAASLTNIASDRAQGRFLLIVNTGVVLHDPRTLDVLCNMADEDNVGSIGVALIEKHKTRKGEKLICRQGGIVPCRKSDPESEDVVLSELGNCSALFRATYPVSANSSALFMVRADAWRKIGGLSTDLPEALQVDVDYGTRSRAMGFVHYCTSAITAGRHPTDLVAVGGEVVNRIDASFSEMKSGDFARSSIVLRPLS